MSRSGYSDDYYDTWSLICWRGAVKSATRGKRGQKLLKDLLLALDSMPKKRLIENSLEANGEFCTLGVLGSQKGIDMAVIDPEDSETVAEKFDIAEALAREIVYMNDEACFSGIESPEHRWQRMRDWVKSQILKQKPL